MSIETFDPNANILTLTDAAVKHFTDSLAKAKGDYVRLGTEVTGCSGYAYMLDIVSEIAAEDTVIEPSPGIKFAITPEALPLVRGTEIDMQQLGVNFTVKFNNPNITGECGCGESFTVV